VGKAAVEFALQGKTAVMPVIKRVSDKPYRWRIDEAPLSRVANKEKMLPARYITKDGFGITEAARRYLVRIILRTSMAYRNTWSSGTFLLHRS
jgi:6-phosphofructokinase 1